MTNFRQDFNSAWTGAVPYTTSGPDNTVGSTRSYHASTVEGAYNLTEQLTKRSISSDGAYTASFEQLKSTVPIEFHGKNGSFDGYWITYRTRYVFEYETAIISNVYSCATGHPQGMSFLLRNSFHIRVVGLEELIEMVQISELSREAHGATRPVYSLGRARHQDRASNRRVFSHGKRGRQPATSGRG